MLLAFLPALQGHLRQAVMHQLDAVAFFQVFPAK
jgi:hypothetical protein